jgi:hypothetical protein
LAAFLCSIKLVGTIAWIDAAGAFAFALTVEVKMVFESVNLCVVGHAALGGLGGADPCKW